MDAARIAKLVIPPAWRRVWIAASPRARLQAVGYDQRGRLQYRYHASQARHRERAKFDRMLQFALALPRLRQQVRRDLRGRELSRSRVMACILRILMTCFLRPGSQAYAAENGSYGIATLRSGHVTVHGDRVCFDFPGKSGKRQHRELRDRDVARVVGQLLAVRSREVFKFDAAEAPAATPAPRQRQPRRLRIGGRTFLDVRRRDINVYIKEVMGAGFSAKDFRTWAGTLVCACLLARAHAETATAPLRSRRRAIGAAVAQTAVVLGNTAAVCRSSYICPVVLADFERGRTIAAAAPDVEHLIRDGGNTLARVERALLRQLRAHRRRGRAGRGDAAGARGHSS